MKKRWLVNLVLLLLVAGLAVFVLTRPKLAEVKAKEYPVAAFDPAAVTKLSIQSGAKKPVEFEKKNGRWFMLAPFQGRADSLSIGRILSIANAVSPEKLPLDDAAKFGLDNPQVRVKMDDKIFDFGMYNPVGGEQFVAHGGSAYTVASSFSEFATTQPLELLDKHPFERSETIVGFDLGALEQWELSKLKVDLQDDGKWKVSAAAAKPNQNEMNEWFTLWENLVATSVEPYTPDRAPHPFILVKLKSGKTVKLIKMQESPELLLVREDEHMQYHFPQDVGFTILNPPAGFRPE